MQLPVELLLVRFFGDDRERHETKTTRVGFSMATTESGGGEMLWCGLDNGRSMGALTVGAILVPSTKEKLKSSTTVQYFF